MSSAPQLSISGIAAGLIERKKVLVLYTGGTMGMKEVEDGSLAPEAGYLTQRIKELPEINREEMPVVTIKEYETLIDSSMMGPADWQMIASDIEENYFNYDGFVVVMGTDTMAYAASALSFMLENLGKTVVFTGSQIPFFNVYNDARRNLIVSILFAATSDFPEVCICFNDKILRACRAVKVSSTSLDAFDSPNFPPLAILGATIQERRELSLPPPRSAFKVHKALDAKVMVLKVCPGFDDECFMALVTHSTSLRAIVLELYGTGNGPSRRQTLLAAIKAAHDKGIVVVALSQCLRGGVSLDTYSMGKEFRQRGVISGGDMTTEACSTKLAYLFGRCKDTRLVEQLFQQNIRGELTPPEGAGDGNNGNRRNSGGGRQSPFGKSSSLFSV